MLLIYRRTITPFFHANFTIRPRRRYQYIHIDRRGEISEIIFYHLFRDVKYHFVICAPELYRHTEFENVYQPENPRLKWVRKINYCI